MRRVLLLLIFPFFLLASPNELLQQSAKSFLYDKNEWKSLLHFNGSLNITDPSFILSKPFSLEKELNATIKGFFENPSDYSDINQHPQCRFPARMTFITHELGISKEIFPHVDCPELNTYYQKAPADSISLIYASDKLNSPTSMMGHSFLKYEGLTQSDNIAQHAVSFYTVIETINPLKLAYQNIFSGMRGMFSLQPYRQLISHYTDKENRNVWEYKLALDEYRKTLIYNHVWELKDLDMDYFFASYNCSTVIYYILALANPDIYGQYELWVTPLETVKLLYRYDLIDQSELKPGNKWMIKMTTEQLDNDSVDHVLKIMQTQQTDEIPQLDIYSYKLLESLLEIKHENQSVTDERYEAIKESMKSIAGDKNATFDISKYKSPNKIPDERQFGIGYKQINNEGYSRVSFLPASHLINDYNREYFGESELRIGYLSLLFNDKSIELDELTLYGIKSYVPYDTLTNDLSFQFKFSIEKEYDTKMKYANTGKLDAGIGLDFLFFNDINLFVILNGGIGLNAHDNLHLTYDPMVGGMIYEIFNMKSYVHYRPHFIDNKLIYDELKFDHNIFLDNKYSLNLGYALYKDTNNDLNDKVFNIQLNMKF